MAKRASKHGQGRPRDDAGRATAVERQARILALLREGLPIIEVRRAIHDESGVGDRTISNDFKAIGKMWQQATGEHADALIAAAMERMQDRARSATNESAAQRADEQLVLFYGRASGDYRLALLRGYVDAAEKQLEDLKRQEAEADARVRLVEAKARQAELALKLTPGTAVLVLGLDDGTHLAGDLTDAEIAELTQAPRPGTT